MSLTRRLHVPIDDDTAERLDRLRLIYPLTSRAKLTGEALRRGIDALHASVPSGLPPIAPALAVGF